MDPLSALSLAGNVIQFIDFGIRLLSSAGELYELSAGSLAVNDELEFVTTDLRALVKKLRTSLPESDSKDMSYGIYTSDRGHDSSSDSLGSICDQAASVADELVEKLESLKIKGDEQKGQKRPKLRHLQSLKAAVKSLWSQKDISALLERLNRLRQALGTRVLMSIRLLI